MENSLTLQDFFAALPARLSYPFNVWFGGSMLTRGKVNPYHDIDLFINGDDDKMLAVIGEIRATVLSTVKLSVFYRPPFMDNPTLPYAVLYVNGVKVKDCPTVPTYDRRDERVRYEDLDAMEKRLRKLEDAINLKV